MRLPGGRQALHGVATGPSVVAWRLGYAEVSESNFQIPGGALKDARHQTRGDISIWPSHKGKNYSFSASSIFSFKKC